MGDEFKRGECRRCGREGEIFSDTDLCETCDGNTIKCAICNEEQNDDDHCRHVFQDEYFQWGGSGMGASLDEWTPEDNVKASFLRLLEAMPNQFRWSLREAILAERFHTWLVAPLIGSGGALSLYGIEDFAAARQWGDQLTDLGQGDRAAEFADGYRWMASLYDADTPDANKLTIGWINQYILEKSAALPTKPPEA